MKPAPSHKSISCLVLSGGLSQRMRSHKALLPFSKNETFIEHIINVYQRAGIEKVIVVLNKAIQTDILKSERKNIQWIVNDSQEKGRLYSIQLGLSCATETDFVFIQDVDNPFVTAELIHQLIASSEKGDYITPIFNNKGGHPVLISSEVRQGILDRKNDGKSLREVLSDFERFKVNTSDECIHRNINTMEDYEKYFLVEA